MVDRRGVHGPDEADVLRHPAGVRQDFGEHHAVFVVLVPVELEGGRRDRESGLTTGHGGDPLAVADRIGEILVESLLQRGLVVVEVELARRTLHVHVDDPLRLRGVMRNRREDLVDLVHAASREGGTITHQRAEGGRAEAAEHPSGHRAEEPTAGEVAQVALERIRGPFLEFSIRHGHGPWFSP